MKLRVSGLIAFLVFAAFVGVASAGEEPKDPLLGKPAPEIKLKDVDGKEWKLSSLKVKKVVLLDFGRSVCLPCRKTAKDLQALHEKYGKKGLQVFQVNLDGPGADKMIAEYAKEEKLTFPFLRDVEFKTAQDYKVRVIPHLVLIDRWGKVRYVHQGYQDDLIKVLSKKIEPLLPKQRK